MTDREKVVSGLEHCSNKSFCNDGCPYSPIIKNANFGIDECITQLAHDALELLKEQEPVEPIEERLNEIDCIYRCGNCKTHFYYRQQKYCAICGRMAKWNG